MFVSDKDAEKRLNSPLNLINALRASNGNSRKNAMSLFIRPAASQIERAESEEFKPEIKLVSNDKIVNPFEKHEEILIPSTPKTDEIVKTADAELKLGLAHNEAIDVLSRSVKMLGDKLDDIPASKLPAVITATSKVVEGIRKERLEREKTGANRDVHYHFYTPQQKSITDYQVIDVSR